MKIKSILVSQPDPGDKRTIYHTLAEKFNLKLDYRPFIELESIPGKELRKQKINILDYSAIIFNSRNAVDNFFRVVEELKVDLPITMKYFCFNEGISLYIQKYTVLRKRKVFYGKGSEKEFLAEIKKHHDEHYLFPCSDIRKATIPDFLIENNIKHQEAIFYKTVTSDLSDLADVYYDIIVFFSPADIKSLFDNFPDFKQNNTNIAGFGRTTDLAILEAGLVNNIKAPTPDCPSMVSALEKFILASNKN
ncbi:MAG: uroporphyrinogen-III synthase [Flavobacteriales bacterium]|nr:uroporphyrinogen-III synthase [Flavobacteriales bacterium]